MTDANQHIKESLARKEKERQYYAKKLAEFRVRQMMEYEQSVAARAERNKQEAINALTAEE